MLISTNKGLLIIEQDGLGYIDIIEPDTHKVMLKILEIDLFKYLEAVHVS